MFHKRSQYFLLSSAWASGAVFGGHADESWRPYSQRLKEPEPPWQRSRRTRAHFHFLNRNGRLWGKPKIPHNPKYQKYLMQYKSIQKIPAIYTFPRRFTPPPTHFSTDAPTQRKRRLRLWGGRRASVNPMSVSPSAPISTDASSADTGRLKFPSNNVKLPLSQRPQKISTFQMFTTPLSVTLSDIFRRQQFPHVL